MRSGNGRHRRPRQAPAIFVTAGVAGGALAMPLLAASSANAADAATWDRVAQCESSGVWSANAGNGFYGGLQLTQEMWDENGGAAYASRPDLASRSQQIAVAESILAARGPDTWPSCAVNAGLKQGGSGPDVDPGGTATPSPERSSPSPSTPPPSSKPSKPSGTPEPGGTRTPEPKPSPTGPAGTPDPSRTPDPSGTGRTQDPSRPADPATPGGGASTSPTAPPSQGKHRGRPAEQPGTGADAGTGADTGTGTGSGSGSGSGDANRSGGGHPSRGGDAHRTDPGAPGDYTVRPGDNLSAIAEDRGVDGGWPALYAANKGVIGGDPDLIHPGQRLELSDRQG
ncbi:transglycosylase family protein [Streptomyces chrestomyceticus]|uniref:transglycosylase family protein n=1 Tax=Streptomyces chrestomyceticus TaxID=68185 RepID=UPI0033F9F2BC